MKPLFFYNYRIITFVWCKATGCEIDVIYITIKNYV